MRQSLRITKKRRRALNAEASSPRAVILALRNLDSTFAGEACAGIRALRAERAGQAAMRDPPPAPITRQLSCPGAMRRLTASAWPPYAFASERSTVPLVVTSATKRPARTDTPRARRCCPASGADDERDDELPATRISLHRYLRRPRAHFVRPRTNGRAPTS